MNDRRLGVGFSSRLLVAGQLGQDAFVHGVALLAGGECAFLDLSQVFRKDPNDYRVKSTLKRIYTTANNLQGFIALLEDVLKDHPDNVKLVGILKGVVKEAGAKSTEKR